MPTIVSAPGAGPDTREMVIVHNVFRRVFGDLTYVIRGVADGDRRRAGTVADTFARFAAALAQHHVLEDELLWPLLLQRVPADSAVVLRAEEQHERVHELLELALRQLAGWPAEARAAQRDALADTVLDLDAALCEHLADEESQVLPLVEQHLSRAEWDRLAAAGAVSATGSTTCAASSEPC